MCMSFLSTVVNHTMKLIIFLVLLIPQFMIINTSAAQVLPIQGEFRPEEPTQYRLFGATERRRLAEPYQLCLLCKCCAAGSATTCATMSCCFGIDCQLPNKPYGVCAFAPKTCNCSSCT